MGKNSGHAAFGVGISCRHLKFHGSLHHSISAVFWSLLLSRKFPASNRCPFAHTGLSEKPGGNMKVFEVRTQVKDSGEYILGSEDTASHACYMIYGVMKPHEKGRVLKPGKGHEEILFAVQGDFAVTGHMQGMLKEGEAIHLGGDETCWLENRGGREAVYVISGGHSGGEHH
jgi:hypothetical protein